MGWCGQSGERLFVEGSRGGSYLPPSLDALQGLLQHALARAQLRVLQQHGRGQLVKQHDGVGLVLERAVLLQHRGGDVLQEAYRQVCHEPVFMEQHLGSELVRLAGHVLEGATLL